MQTAPEVLFCGERKKRTETVIITTNDEFLLNHSKDIMPVHVVNLDALIRREDFQVTEGEIRPATVGTTMKISELEPTAVTFSILRKPDFQRETANWKPAKVAELIQSFVEGDLIPSVILWRSPSTGNLFVIDGAHRLSALIAWVHDDYGDRTLSRSFYDNNIANEQEQAGAKTRKLVEELVGSYAELQAAARNPENSSEKRVRYGRNLGTHAIQLQMVEGDAKRAEESFFRINQKATAINPTELEVIQSRAKPNAMSARAILRSGVGHKYWSDFDERIQKRIQELAREIFDILFIPNLGEPPVKTLDLPVAGRGYSADSLPIVFEFANLAIGVSNNTAKKKELQADTDGKATIACLEKMIRLARRISGTHSSSLGLHPAVYFYGATGRYQSAAFLGAVRFVQYLTETKQFIAFTKVREQFENFLLEYKYLPNQIVAQHGSGWKSLDPMFSFYRVMLEQLTKGNNAKQVYQALITTDRLQRLRLLTEEDKEYKREFSKETKSALFLKDAVAKAITCPICNARVHRESISYDHKIRRAEGGVGSPDNGQITHPFCNSGVKESDLANAAH